MNGNNECPATLLYGVCRDFFVYNTVKRRGQRQDLSGKIFKSYSKRKFGLHWASTVLLFDKVCPLTKIVFVLRL